MEERPFQVESLDYWTLVAKCCIGMPWDWIAELCSELCLEHELFVWNVCVCLSIVARCLEQTSFDLETGREGRGGPGGVL